LALARRIGTHLYLTSVDIERATGCIYRVKVPVLRPQQARLVVGRVLAR